MEYDSSKDIVSSIELEPEDKDSEADRSTYQTTSFSSTAEAKTVQPKKEKDAETGKPICDRSDEKPNDNHELATLACICNAFVGIVAISFAFKSIDAYRQGNIKAARRHGYMALFCSIFAFAVILGICLAVVIIIYDQRVLKSLIPQKPMTTVMSATTN